MKQSTIRNKAHRVTRFILVQFIALMGWILVQTFFFLSPVGHTIPFSLTLLIEAIWWMGLLVIMLLLFLVEYNRFVQAVIDLEEANRRLRIATNTFLDQQRHENSQDAQPENAEDIALEKDISEQETKKVPTANLTLEEQEIENPFRSEKASEDQHAEAYAERQDFSRGA